MPTLKSGVGRTLLSAPSQLFATQVQVLPIGRLKDAAADCAGGWIVLDALDADAIALPVLARAVHWQRRLIPRGRLILAVSPAAARSLIASGLHHVLAYRLTLESAIDAATAALLVDDRVPLES